MDHKADTAGVEVHAEAFYLPEHSRPEMGRYTFGYLVTIANHTGRTVKLLERHWRITDALGRVQEVHGKGIVGEQPDIPPGESYRYSSACPLTTPHGYMEGHYTLADDAGERFQAEVPMFILSLPGGRPLN